MKTIPLNVIRDDFATGTIQGSARDDHLIHHRAPTVQDPVSTNLVSFAGDDILEASVPDAGQIHMYAGSGNDWIRLDVTKITNAKGVQGHHVYGGSGQNTFHFTNIDNNLSPILGRIDDFDPTSDRIIVENEEISLAELPKTIYTESGRSVLVRIMEGDLPEFLSEQLGSQYFLAIGDDIFYALEGARDLKNGTSGRTGEERHFLHRDALETLRSSETVDYLNPKNFVPREFFEHREDDLALNWAFRGVDVSAERGSMSGALMHGSKQTTEELDRSGAQIMRGADGDDIINGNTGNDTIFAGEGNNLVAGGIDDDLIFGGLGDDMLWGGDGNDTLMGVSGDNYLHGGRGDDILMAGDGNDTLSGGRGNDTLIGSENDESTTRFHLYADEGKHQIKEFNLSNDFITIQDVINPATVSIFENSFGNTVITYGEKATVELVDVSLQNFQSSAEDRAASENPLISISPDPEKELLQDMQIKLGIAGDENAPPLLLDGVLYGTDAFSGDGPGGYNYVSEESISGRDTGAPPVDQGQLPDGGSFEDDCHELISDESNYPDCGCGLGGGCLTEDATKVEPEPEKNEPDDLLLDMPSQGEDEPPAFEDEDGEKENAEVSGSCFVATAAFRSSEHPDVIYLRRFRDTALKQVFIGRLFIAFYWKVGPVLAKPVSRNNFLAAISRLIIHSIVIFIKYCQRNT